jgi:D-serine deaminase-like pyridoxal phosphate-dependent protein
MHDHMSVVKALAGRTLPAVVVDLDAFDRNVERHVAALGDLPLRVATKSLRVAALIQRVVDRAAGQVRGLLCYSAREAVKLAERGFRDLLVAYPTVDVGELAAVAGVPEVTLAVDCADGVDRVAAAGAQAGVEIRVVLDLDMSYEVAGLHLGVRRSPVRTPEAALALARHAAGARGVKLDGILAYEAQIAGLADRGPMVRLFKRTSMKEVAARRLAIVEALRADGHELRVVNGGGVGSIEITTAATGVNEIAAGSGFYKPHLFDGYRSPFLRSLEPSCFFALPVVRAQPGFVTCLGGGYVASGEVGRDKQPLPFAPAGLRMIDAEMAGEVQTPLAVPGDVALKLGDVVLFRAAKAGEIMERFAHVLLVQGGEVVGETPTYRGEGWSFF